MSAVRNPARERLERGEVSLGLGIRLSRSVDIAKILKTSGYDWLFLDLEHGTMSLDTALCNKCLGMNECPSSNMGDYGIPPQHLGSAALTKLSACVNSAATCGDVDTCFSTQFPTLAACFK